jgi:uncharacterized membrane protein YhaH (DUF805 family)
MAQALCFIVAVVMILKAVMSRFHDIGWSGSAVLLMFVPLVDIVALFIIAGRTRAEKAKPLWRAFYISPAVPRLA